MLALHVSVGCDARKPIHPKGLNRRFANPGGLDSLGGNLYKESQASGQALSGNPNENGFGSVRQGFTERSNVKVVEEMVNLIVSQRAYEVNSKAVQSADEMMQMANNLRR